jgi:hypothetical protein
MRLGLGGLDLTAAEYSLAVLLELPLLCFVAGGSVETGDQTLRCCDNKQTELNTWRPN